MGDQLARTRKGSEDLEQKVIPDHRETAILTKDKQLHSAPALGRNLPMDMSLEPRIREGEELRYPTGVFGMQSVFIRICRD